MIQSARAGLVSGGGGRRDNQIRPLETAHANQFLERKLSSLFIRFPRTNADVNSQRLLRLASPELTDTCRRRSVGGKAFALQTDRVPGNE